MKGAEMDLFVVTDAPEAYDGFGTETIRTVSHGEAENIFGFPLRGRHADREWRLVRIPDEAQGPLDWQVSRYASGLWISQPVSGDILEALG